ncbi:MAG: hypothetical protein HPY45_14275 [Anaerolineae bacterium]|nr:hypothetical protein [Anaerolineae bacterium]
MKRRRPNYSYYYPERPEPIESAEGIKALSRRGAFARNWWATRWIEAMERLLDYGRLARGRSYARRGQVLSIEETKDGIHARVQGSRPKPYTVTIRVEPLSDAQWEQVIDALAEQALFAAQLLAGEMPHDIEDAFQTAGVSLFPARRSDLATHCSCPDWANPCKHIAATHYILGERFDEDPFLLFRLRGRNQEQILEALRQRRAGIGETDEAEEEEADALETSPPLTENLERFWSLAAPLEPFPIEIKPPAITMPLLKRLGDPPFAPDLQSLLYPAYHAVSQFALAVAFADSEKEE